MTELLLVRHALPEGGVMDPGLSQTGVAQAERLAGWLTGERVDAVCTSPYQRARDTAAPVERRLGMIADVLDDLREWDGETVQPVVYTPLEEFDPGDPRAVALAEGRFEDFVPELDLPAFRGRISRVMNQIMDAHPGGRVVVVSHGGLINAYLAMVIGAPRVFWFHPGYTSVSRVRRVPAGRVVVESVNETAHLVADRRVPAAEPVPVPGS
ncbi:histidine phosphatase family protein [Actinomadura sp. 6N118]|uniref:histidine phosphatase family protein n=1 Tax=Actinomadura sp. 6N118 TaxID=3375151 RepID=UPI0037B827A2